MNASFSELDMRLFLDVRIDALKDKSKSEISRLRHNPLGSSFEGMNSATISKAAENIPRQQYNSDQCH